MKIFLFLFLLLVLPLFAQTQIRLEQFSLRGWQIRVNDCCDVYPFTAIRATSQIKGGNGWPLGTIKVSEASTDIKEYWKDEPLDSRIPFSLSLSRVDFPEGNKWGRVNINYGYLTPYGLMEFLKVPGAVDWYSRN